MTENKSIIDLAQGSQGGGSPRPPQHTDQPQNDSNTPKRPQTNSNQKVSKSSELNDILNKLLSKVEEKTAWIPIILPTMGMYNDSQDSEIMIRPFTFEDEKILRSINKLSDGNRVIKSLVTRCTQGIEYDDLALVDKNYILFKLREVSYGDDYNIEATCNECGASHKLKISIADLPVNYIDTTKPIENSVYLPDSEVTLEYRITTAKDEDYFTNPNTLMDNLWRLVTSVDGHTERIIIQGFIQKSTAKDIAYLRNKLDKSEIGLQTKVNFICTECNFDSVIELPINESFFNVN
jgi:hypothetical protein